MALRLSFDSGGPNSPAIAGFHGDIATLTDPTQSRAIKEGVATLKPHAADHLEQIRQAIDHVATQNAASNGTVIETGIPESESLAAESLAILM